MRNSKTEKREDWRDKILREFTPEVAGLTLVADPDGLMLEERILQEIRDQGFELILFEDSVAFRFAYESKYRTHWDHGQHVDLVVVLHAPASDLNHLPYDLLQRGRSLAFSLQELFPALSYPVVAALDRSDLASLYAAQRKHSPGKLGENATKDFVLRHVFEVAPELIKKPHDLLRTLLRRHYRGRGVPAILDQRLISLLREEASFGSWPLEQILPDREAFFAFLQERWPVFLDKVSSGRAGTTSERKEAYGLTFCGPDNLPFDHDDVRIYVENLFIEGWLHSVSHERAAALGAQWVRVGVRTDPEEERLRRVTGLIESVRADLPSHGSRYGDWLQFAYRWAELTALWADADSELARGTRDDLSDLRRQVDTVFQTWVLSRYAGLYNQPALPPVMVHHIPRTLARRLEENKNRRVALVLLDGLSLDQWIVLRDVLREQCHDLGLRESAVFAWIPTITSVSRQAAFAGKPPIYFSSSVYTTDRDSFHWHQFWMNQGLKLREVVFSKALGDSDTEDVCALVSNPTIRAAGLVIDKIDKIMHGMELGTAGMHNQIRQWATQGHLALLLGTLLDHGFHIVLTSDHGNVESNGIGSPSEGAVADLRGQRVRVFPDCILRTQVKTRFPDALEWPPVGLPENFLPLLAPGRLAFVRKTERIVGHGGITLEELIVPCIQAGRTSDE
ncbi:MAG: BREX-3 system phosphatase PglZ [Armatimonadetes bacterium]|nr:BREX-3 system phosphatase PglZ [Armatimonadota bacterium]